MIKDRKPENSLKYPKMKALKLALKLDPIQLGVYYLTDPTKTKKRLYLIDLQNLLLMADAQLITEAIYEQHSDFFRDDKIPFDQVMKLIQKMIDFIQNEIMGDDDIMEEDDYSPKKNRRVT